MSDPAASAPRPRRPVGEPTRLRRAERRAALLDAAVELVESLPLDAVTMDAVAERAGVSRPLVYRHFANRGDLLAATYEREVADLHDALTEEVSGAGSLVDMFRALVHGALQAAEERGRLFAALRSAGAWSPEVGDAQRVRDRRTSKAFARRAEREHGIDGERAVAVTGLLLSLVDPTVAQWRHDPTPEHAALLEDTYMTVVEASLAAVADRPRP